MISWVIGSGGLLGTALCRALHRKGDELFVPDKRLCWGDDQALADQVATTVDKFASRVQAVDQWQLYWAAGVGTMSSSAQALEPEARALTQVLKSIESHPQIMAKPGAIAFASSAGAIYAESSDEVITERSQPTPTTAYARAKLLQEELLASFVKRNRCASALIARISTLYGPGQASAKKQGLLTHMARCILRNQPIQIYVPFDTIRDYIAADDAAEAMIRALARIGEPQQTVIRIVASERPTTIAEIVSIFKRIARRGPRIVTSASRLSGLYTRRVQFRSMATQASPSPPAMSLAVGIAQLMLQERVNLARGGSQ
ncbi:MAG: NAD(P)-dependent oxidoreductase [Gammaproteobacteria bacterium]|uniref:NAD-dependent epimerase/dehydratase family protein n=1 Tax=Rhodoferax sp. TaxID=50421 RepID=UPI001E1667F7|nr:NAD(P)-dependent oxidoreductase [Rhodoferax sp.]MBU3897498.1 NAD(P)-dependent oxidoreductase [Gammaproteobacteria bacterium]